MIISRGTPPGGVPMPPSARLLLIDDEEVLLRALKRGLARHFDVTAVSSAADALALLDGGERYDVVLCDLIMPGQSGRDFHREVAARHPDLEPQVRFLSGGVFASDLRDFIDTMPERLLDKPVELARLVAFLMDAVKPAHHRAAG